MRVGGSVPGQLSVAVAAPRSVSLTNTVAVVEPDPVARRTFAGAMSVGALSSTTVTFCVAVAVLPAASVAVQVTGVVPTANTLPDGERVNVTAPVAPVVVGVPSAPFGRVAPQIVAPAAGKGITSAGAGMLRGGFPRPPRGVGRWSGGRRAWW